MLWVAAVWKSCADVDHICCGKGISPFALFAHAVQSVAQADIYRLSWAGNPDRTKKNNVNQNK